MTKIVKGSQSTTIRRGAYSAPIRYVGFDEPTVDGIQWQGDDSFVLNQSAEIDFFNEGTVGELHLVERVYQKGTTTEFCVSADTGDRFGIDYVDVYYGGPKPTRQSSVTKRNGVQGYWFDLTHDDVASIQERKIYAKIVPRNTKQIISKVVSKTIRIGDLTTISLDPSDCLGSTTHLHRRVRWDNQPSGAGSTTNGVVYELSSGIYYWLDDSAPSEPAVDPWVEVRAADGASVEIRVMSVGSIPDATRVANFNRSDRAFFRVKHLVFDGITFNLNERFQILAAGAYIAFDGCTVIDPPMNLYTCPAGSIKRAREFDGTGTSNFFTQEFIKKPEGDYENRVEFHRSKFHASAAGNCSEYYDTEFACTFDVFYYNRPVDSLTIKNCIQHVPYGNNSPDLTSLRFLLSDTGVRNGTWSGPGSTGDYIYAWDDVQDISKMVYEIRGIDTTTNSAEYRITLDATPTGWPERFTPGVGFGTNHFFDWVILKWDSGDDLIRSNRKLVDKPVNDSTLCVSWTTTNDATGVLSDVMRLYRTTGADVETAGFNFADLNLSVGDRISVVIWAHSDFIQTSGTTTSMTSVLVQDVVSVFEQQTLYQSPGQIYDFVLSNCLMFDPTGIKSDLEYKYERPEKLRQTFKNCSLVHNDIVIRTDTLDANEFDLRFYGSMILGIEGFGGASSWPLEIRDCVYESVDNVGTGAGTTIVNSSQWTGSLGIDAYGVANSGGNAEFLTSIGDLPYGVDGALRSGASWQVGAHSAAGVSYIPRIADYFIGYPSASVISPTAPASVSVIDGQIETDKVSPSISYAWHNENGVISGETLSAFDTTGRVGERLWCLVTHGDAKHWVDFGIVQ
jgi:hypothetical protein